MNPVTIPASALPESDYAHHVATQGHVPGVLSGAELKGKAREYGSSYARMRARVEAAVKPYGIAPRLILHPDSRRYARVWTDDQGQPVKLVMEGAK